jgi:Ca2+-binding EF-hand superfamily protein
MKKQILISALILTATTGIALAQDAPRNANRLHHGFFAAMDTNGDGVISQEEIDQRQAERFQRMDTDGDGVLSVDELYNGLQRERAERMHKWLDRNGDGQVSQEEFNAIHSKKFSRLDRDGDGTLSKEELQPRGHRKGKGRMQPTE